jgi:hypothetical protein
LALLVALAAADVGPVAPADVQFSVGPRGRVRALPAPVLPVNGFALRTGPFGRLRADPIVGLGAGAVQAPAAGFAPAVRIPARAFVPAPRVRPGFIVGAASTGYTAPAAGVVAHSTTTAHYIQAPAAPPAATVLRSVTYRSAVAPAAAVLLRDDSVYVPRAAPAATVVLPHDTADLCPVAPAAAPAYGTGCGTIPTPRATVIVH